MIHPRPAIEDLARFVPHVIVPHPRGPADNLALYRLLGGIFNRQALAKLSPQPDPPGKG